MDQAQLERTLRALEERLSRIETLLKVPPAPQPAPPPPVAAPTTAVPPTRPAFQAPPPRELELPHMASGNWLGFIAVICFVVAAAFIVKLSIDSGWLTPLRQAGLAGVLGFGLIVVGLALKDMDRAYAALLPGAGVIILYLTVFAAHRYYGLIPFEVALALTAFVSALCIALYTNILHDFYAFTAAAGAYLGPVILDFHAAAMFSLYYFLLCSVAFAAISVWLRSRLLTIVAAYLAILLTGAIGAGLKADILVAEIMAFHFIIFAAGTYFHTAHTKQSLTRGEAVGFLPVLLIFYAQEYMLIHRQAPALAPWLSLGFAAVLIAMYVSVKAWFAESRNSQWLIVSLTAIIVFHAGYLVLLPEAFRPYLFSAILIAAVLWQGRMERLTGGDVFLFPQLGLLAILLIEYLSLLQNLVSFHMMPVSAFLALASLWAVIARRRGIGYDQILLGAAHILALLAFYRLTANVSSLAVSALWLLYGAGVMIFAFVRKDEFMAKSALAVLVFAAGKALLYDAASAPTIVRILCLLLTGAVLYGCGLLMRKFRSWTVESGLAG